jgi:hypothetical protein
MGNKLARMPVAPVSDDTLELSDTRETPAPVGDTLLTVELEAMATIGRVLDAIQDPDIRQRVLNWACERWGDPVQRAYTASKAAANDPTLSLVPIAESNDPNLSVDSIDDLFSDARDNRPGASSAPEPVGAAASAKAPVESMLRSLAADFQRLTDEWNGA